MVNNQAGLGGADDLGNLVEVGFLQTLQALEVLDEGCARSGPDTLYRVEFTYGLSFRTAVAMMGDAKTVGLVAQGLDDAQAGTCLVDIKW